MPNILTIDKIDKILDGKHPDNMTDIKSKFKLGLFLAKPKKDPLTKAFIHGSLNAKHYKFNIPNVLTEKHNHDDDTELNKNLEKNARDPQNPENEGGLFSYRPGKFNENKD